MVTANSAPRFKDRSIMSDSYIEQYIRAKKRHPVAPKCLFGAPRRSETDEFLLQHEIDQMKETKEVFDRYDLSEIADGPEKDDIFPKFEAESIAATTGDLKFQPIIITERDRPPADNLFVPIEKARPSGAVAGDGVVQQANEITEYWQTSKRRRSSNAKEDTPDEEKPDVLPQSENNVKDEQNPQE